MRAGTEHMAKKRRPLALALEYYAARALVLFLAIFPLSISAWIGRRFGGVWRLLDKSHRRRAEHQVEEVLGLDPPAARAFVKTNFGNFGMALAEFAHLTRMRADDFRRYVDYGDFEKTVHGLLAEGKGLLFITAHFGNWEWCNSNAATMGLTGGSIARPLDNPRLNEFVRSVREKNGLKIFDKTGAIRKALRALQANGVVGILFDQYGGRDGMLSPFLGKPAYTFTVPVELAMRTGSPMIVVGLMRGGKDGKRFTMLYQPEPFRHNPDAEPEAEKKRLADALNVELGRMIMQAPEQWFWIHRRWKSPKSSG